MAICNFCAGYGCPNCWGHGHAVDPQVTIDKLRAEVERLQADHDDNKIYREEAVIHLDRAEKAEATNKRLRDLIREIVDEPLDYPPTIQWRVEAEQSLEVEGE